MRLGYSVGLHYNEAQSIVNHNRGTLRFASPGRYLVPWARIECFKLAIMIKYKAGTASIIARFGYRIEEGVITEDNDLGRPFK